MNITSMLSLAISITALGLALYNKQPNVYFGSNSIYYNLPLFLALSGGILAILPGSNDQGCSGNLVFILCAISALAVLYILYPNFFAFIPYF